MLPTQQEIDKLSKRIKDITEKYNNGINEKDACQIVRSAIRKSWMRHPVKILVIDLNTKPDMNPLTRTKWKVKCDRCNEYFKKNEIEVDHIVGEHQMSKLSHIPEFVNSILNVTTNDLQVLCNNCHRIKTYAERQKISEYDAEIKLNALDWIKYIDIKEQIEYFETLGYSTKECSNAKKRKMLAIELKIHK